MSKSFRMYFRLFSCSVFLVFSALWLLTFDREHLKRREHLLPQWLSSNQPWIQLFFSYILLKFFHKINRFLSIIFNLFCLLIIMILLLFEQVIPFVLAQQKKKKRFSTSFFNSPASTIISIDVFFFAFYRWQSPLPPV